MNDGAHPADFSLVDGGLLSRVLRRAGLSDDVPSKVRLRLMVFALLAWLPLAVLSALDGRLLGAGVAVPFLLDVEVHVRFLVALPLLIMAEIAVQRRLPPLLQQFAKRHLVTGDRMQQFTDAVASAFRMRAALLPEVLLIAFVYGVGILIVWRHYLALDVDTWYAARSADGSTLTLAGMWYAFVSVPIVQFLLLRWYFRLWIWARLLWRVSRIDLNLIPAHPDQTGGLGFLASTAYAFTMLAMAHGALAAGPIASRIFFTGATLSSFADEIGVLVIAVLCALLGPLLFFAPQLAAAKQGGQREYSMLAERYVRAFDAKWVGGEAPEGGALLGSGDIQSLADLGGAYEMVRSMRITPISRQAIFEIAVAALIPISPLLLTMIPLGELLKKLLGIVF